MNKKAKKILLNSIYPIAAIIVLLIVWQFFYLAAGSEFIFPSVGAVLKKITRYMAIGYFWQSFFSTLSRVAAAFLIAFIVAAAVGAAGYYFPVIRKILLPYIKIMISVPTVAVMLILNMLPINKSFSPIIVSLTIIFPMTYASVNAAIEQIDVKLLEMAKVYGVSAKKRITSLIIPSVLPYIIEQAGTTLAFTLKITVSAEIIAYTYKSLGGILQQANAYLDMAGVMAVTILSVLAAVVLEYTVKGAVFIYKRLKRYD